MSILFKREKLFFSQKNDFIDLYLHEIAEYIFVSLPLISLLLFKFLISYTYTHNWHTIRCLELSISPLRV